jgi:hypothetical protein
LPLPQRLQLQKAGSLSIGVYIISISLTGVQSAGVGAGVGAVVGTGAVKSREPQMAFWHDLAARNTLVTYANLSDR